MAEKLIQREKWEGKSWWLSSFYLIRELQADVVEKSVV
jgi:hypothetical protein